MDRATREAIGRLAEEIARIDRRTRTQGRAHRVPQLAHSSLEEGQALEVRGPGGVRQRIGWLPDGSVGMVTEGGDPVSAPSAPTVVPSLGGLRVSWDGTLANEVSLPGDFDHMAVHVSTSPGFEPSAATHVGTIRRAGEGGMLPVIPLPYVEHYVVLVPVTTGGIHGDPSVEVAATPLQVEGPDLVAGSIDTAHLAAESVDASKLAAILVLASRIVAGVPGAARVELDQGGLRGYDESGALVFAIDSAGNAVFTGNITGSEITGSRMVIGDPAGSGNYGVIEETPNGQAVMQVIAASTAYGQMMANETQAEYSVWGSDAPDTPAGGIIAHSNAAEFVLYSNAGASDTTPIAAFSAMSGQAHGRWESPTGSRIRVVAREDYTALFTTPEASTTGEPDVDVDGSLYAYRFTTGTPAMSMQSPVVNTGPGAGMRAMVHVMGTTSTRDYARAEIHARRVVVGAEWDQINQVFTDEPGVLYVDPTHSIASDRHAPQTTYLQAQPTGAGSGGDWVDFTEGEFPSIAFTTAWSGRVKVTVQHTGASNASPGATLSTSFRLSGGTTLPADLSRSAMSRAAAPRGDNDNGNLYSIQQQQVFFLNLPGITDIALTPAWRTSGTPTWGSDVYYDDAYNTSITVENLM